MVPNVTLGLEHSRIMLNQACLDGEGLKGRDRGHPSAGLLVGRDPLQAYGALPELQLGWRVSA